MRKRRLSFVLYHAGSSTGGISLSLLHFRTFFLKNRFLSDYVVPACPKYISGKLRSFSNFFFHAILFENFLPNGVSVAAAKKQLAQGLGTPQNRLSAKKSIFSKSEISIPQSNHGKRNIKLILVRPQKRFRTDISDFEKIDFFGHGRFLGVLSPWEG